MDWPACIYNTSTIPETSTGQAGTAVFLRFEPPFETPPILIPRCTWMYCFFQCSESPSKVHLTQKKALRTCHEDHRVSFLHSRCFVWLWMVTQHNLHVAPGIPEAHPLPPLSPSHPWCRGVLHPCGGQKGLEWEGRGKVARGGARNSS